MTLDNPSINPHDSYGLGRRIFRKLVHFFSYHFIIDRNRTTSTEAAGLHLKVGPGVFHPKIFLTSEFFAKFLQAQDLTGRSVVEVGTGSGILALSAAKAGAAPVLALDINPQAVATAAANAELNGLPQVEARHSNLFSAVSESEKFDIVLSSPPSFGGEPKSMADRAWHAGPGYRDILPLFDQAAARLKPGGVMYLLISSDTNAALFDHLIEKAGFTSTRIATQSIVIEEFYLYELRQRTVAAIAAE
ncbi:MAG: hypothetical protein A4S14_02785 [Proteobacteria bacterium SG_bin9]|nr:MAG: hypothetical protein A4S14_02785 [Proteobacteria bacterium SG_bin9]